MQPVARILSITITILLLSRGTLAQNYERYQPLTPSPRDLDAPQLAPAPEPATGSDRQLVDRLDAVVVYSDKQFVEPRATNANLNGLVLRIGSAPAWPVPPGPETQFHAQPPASEELLFPEDGYDQFPNAPLIDPEIYNSLFYQPASAPSLVFSLEFRDIVEGYLGRPISLRSLNQMSRDILNLYRHFKQPVVDVLIPEQNITGGTVQIVVIEATIGRVVVNGGQFFAAESVARWIQDTRIGDSIYEPNIEKDLFWLNQNPFRTVTVDLLPGQADGYTDVFYNVSDLAPIRAYLGYDDTGVQTLGRDRLLAGFTYGNMLGRDGLLSYQHTSDTHFDRLKAHAANYTQPIDRERSFNVFGSWARVNPDFGFPLHQTGQSWQVGAGLTQYICKTRWAEEYVYLGGDFKSTDNDLEFGGATVGTSAANLFQFRLGYSRLRRRTFDEYRLFQADLFVGPGDLLSSSARAFSTIRPGTSPDYVYGRVSYHEARILDPACMWMLTTRATAQWATDRLLFSETLGLGGFDSIRSYDQRTQSGDYGWRTSFELGPRPAELCFRGLRGRKRFYTFVDLGQVYAFDRQPTDQDNPFMASVGVGMQMAMAQDLSFRFDYGHGLTDVPGYPKDRVHLGLIWQFGPGLDNGRSMVALARDTRRALQHQKARMRSCYAHWKARREALGWRKEGRTPRAPCNCLGTCAESCNQDCDGCSNDLPCQRACYGGCDENCAGHCEGEAKFYVSRSGEAGAMN